MVTSLGQAFKPGRIHCFVHKHTVNGFVALLISSDFLCLVESLS